MSTTATTSEPTPKSEQQNPAFTNNGGGVGGQNDSVDKPRTGSFKDSDKYVRSKSGTFVRKNSDAHDRSGSGTMPEFRSALKDKLAKTRDAMPQGEDSQSISLVKTFSL